MALLGVPDQLGETARTAQELASATSAAPGPLARLLAAASLYGLVSQAGDGRFALTPMGARLRTDIPGSMRSMASGFLAPRYGRPGDSSPRSSRRGGRPTRRPGSTSSSIPARPPGSP